jgi:signal transduction histidine kinase/DNA-binding NarL/FixJ family response regulator
LTPPLKFLLVEDSPDDAEMVLLELRRGGFQVEAARVDTAAALEAALAERPWDLVLSDYRMPGFTGMDALRILRASGLDIPFVLVTGAIGEEAAVAAVKEGAHGYVLKHNLVRLCPVVERELRDGAARQEQRQAKEELARSEERYRALFEHSPIPMAVMDYSKIQGRFERWRDEGVQDVRAFLNQNPDEVRWCARAARAREGNAARKQFFGEDGLDADAAFLDGWFLDASWPVFLDVLVALAEGATVFHGELPLRTSGGDKIVALNFSVNPGYELTLARVLVSALDITERVQMQAALRDLDRVSAKGQMAAYVAHEINNPLAGIKNAFALLEPAIPLDHPRRHYADLIKREIDRIAGIIRTLYHVHRPPSADLGDVLLNEVFQDIQNLLVPMCRAAGVALVLELQDPGLKVRFNGGMLRQVIFNLAQNAVEASPRDGSVVLGGRRSAEVTEITVWDQGPGIPPEWAERVFQQGFSSKRDSGMSGLGLGLSTCKSIVESVGGTLDFSSVPGQGCSFRVRVPHGGVPGLSLPHEPSP